MTAGGTAGVPIQQDHIDQAEHNEGLALSLLDTPHTDWAVTALFYAALHLLDAYLTPQGRLTSHQERIGFVFRSPDFSSAASHYRELLDRSQDARYDCARFNSAFARALVQSDFEPFKRQAHRLLGI